MGEMRTEYKVLVGKPEGTKELRSPRLRWENNVEVDLMEMVWESVNSVHLAWIVSYHSGLL
jgi:hypothetical protein